MTSYPIDPGRLARHAARLAVEPAVDSVPGLTTRLRRSTSAAYYAVFHAIALGMASHLAPRSDDEVRYRLARSLDHGRLADVCGWLVGACTGRREVRPIIERLRRNGALVSLAAHILRLQAARHDADYDHLAEIGPALAADHHDRARTALRLLDELAGSPDLAELYALVALHSTLR